MNELDENKMRKNPFVVPEGYFEDLTDRVMDECRSQKAKKKTGLMHVLYPYIGFAAVFIVGMLVADAFLPQKTSSADAVTLMAHEDDSSEVKFDESFKPTDEEILEYLQEDIYAYRMILAEIY